MAAETTWFRSGHQPVALLYCVRIKSSNGPGRCVIIVGKFSYWLSGALFVHSVVSEVASCTATTSVEPNSWCPEGIEGTWPGEEISWNSFQMFCHSTRLKCCSTLIVEFKNKTIDWNEIFGWSRSTTKDLFLDLPGGGVRRNECFEIPEILVWSSWFLLLQGWEFVLNFTFYTANSTGVTVLRWNNETDAPLVSLFSDLLMGAIGQAINPSTRSQCPVSG